MAKRKAGNKKAKQAGNGDNGGIVSLTKELFQAAITLRGSVEPADYKRYVLPIIFLRILSMRYDRRRAELETLVADKKSDYFGDKKAIHDPDEYRRVGAFVILEAARWENLRKTAQADDIKVKLDDVLESLENKYPDKLKGLLPRIYAGSNLDAVSMRGLINLFSTDIFEADHGGDDPIGRVYEYFIGEFASSEGKRGGEYFTPASIVKTIVAMLEPEKGVLFDPCCGSGGMVVQSDLFTKHNYQLSFVGHPIKVQWPSRRLQESIVDVLGALDDKISLNRATNDKALELGSVLFTSWFVDFAPVGGHDAKTRSGPRLEGILPKSRQNGGMQSQALKRGDTD